MRETKESSVIFLLGLGGKPNGNPRGLIILGSGGTLVARGDRNAAVSWEGFGGYRIG
jgi:hypothetical protein